MSSAVANYQLSGFTGLMSHGWRLPRMARDEACQEIDAEVRSGDYFVTVATTLDLLSRKAADYEVKLALENIVSDLIYLQDNYTITKLNERSDT